MDNDDIKCLPDDFVGKPSKVIENLYKKRENAERKALEKMRRRKKEICERYEKLIEEKSDEYKKNSDDIKRNIKNELFESRTKANYDNADNMEKASFKEIHSTIKNYTIKRHDLVDELSNDLLILEKNKSNEFKVILKDAYEAIKRISFKLPSEYDECIELEIEKINQKILCNQRYYNELATQLHLEVENDCKNFTIELQQVKDCWVKYLRYHTNKSITILVKKDPAYLKSAERLRIDGGEIRSKMELASSITRVQQANDWLASIRHTLAKLDNHSQKIIAAFKQAAVFVFNRFFQELSVIADQLDEMIEKEDIELLQTEMYAPTLQEMHQLYDADLDTIQLVWNELVEQLSKTVDNTHNFLLAGATLWEKHFRRTEVLEVVVLKDVDNTIIGNNAKSEPYETKLNVLIDTLRQEPTRERLQKTLDDIKKLLVAMEELYKTQYQTEMGVYKKYKATQEFKIDLLLMEIKRFLTVYPPDLEKDPKIQRKRASWTSEIADEKEALIPNQMMFCKYQIDAASNWQFGLWEAITNYTKIAKTEILGEIDTWVKSQSSRLDKRLEVRLGIHSLRMEKIIAYIYDVRLEELCIHRFRFDEHKNAADKQINDFKEQCSSYLEKYDEMYECYDQNLKQLESKCIKLEKSSMVNAYKIVLLAKTDNCVEDINELNLKYLQKCNSFFQAVKASNVKFAENMKMFLEGGNFAIQETRDYLKLQSKIEAQVEKSLTSIIKEIENGKGKVVIKIQARKDEVLNMLHFLREEHVFLETIEKKVLSVKNDLKKEVCNFHFEFKRVAHRFEDAKIHIASNSGDYQYLDSFIANLKDYVTTIERLGHYLCHSSPIVMYSYQSFARDQSSPRSSSEKREEHESSIHLKFCVQEAEDNYLMNLNKILFKHWTDITAYARSILTNRLLSNSSIMSKAERTARGQDWATSIEKEAALKSLWFRKNEERLNEIANKVPSRKVPEEMKEAVKQERIAGFQNIAKHPRIKMEDVVPEFGGALDDIMKPVDPAMRKLIYTGNNKDGRINYLHSRIKILPEDRYYFPECTSWEYGWKMWNHVKTIRKLGFGRQQVIKDSFYRRRGVDRDPDWYREPAHISPTFCNTCVS